MIAINNLSMSYPLEAGSLEVLSGVNMRIADGETVAIVGPSGSGKTTLLILLAGLEAPAAGSIAIDGEDITGLDADALADLRRDKLGIVFQSFHLVPSLTALGNVSLPIEIAGGNDARERARRLLERVGLAERAQHYPSQLSGGEQQRVAIARALAHSPNVLLADEPTGNLDLKTGAKIIEMLFELNAETGSTMVLVTHDTEIARRCQRVFYLDDGKLVEDSQHAVPA
ncbi:MAG: ABC transporter ATP-binding protein [Gammaproteobacteria bacterium]|nr:ABC transporter ATP-binding protein [Gammaproteobacteria bacterium]